VENSLKILIQVFLYSGSSHFSTGTVNLFPYCHLDQILEMKIDMSVECFTAELETLTNDKHIAGHWHIIVNPRFSLVKIK
jgi:hypothetical protein